MTDDRAGRPDTNPHVRIAKALDIIMDYGQVAGAHHKAWVTDQVLRALAPVNYQQFVASYESTDPDGITVWDERIAP